MTSTAHDTPHHTHDTHDTHATTRPQLRLPGQAAAPEGPVDMSMMYLMHHAFRRDLAALAEAVPVTPVEDRATWRALADRWDLFSTTLHHHHEGEDAWIWPALVERADEGERATLAAMEAEHAEIDPLLEACAAGFARMREHADTDARSALAVRLVAARESLGRHLRHEETEAIALIQRVMTQADWEAADDHLKEGLTLGLLVRAVPWVMHQVPTAVQQQVVAESGPAHRLLWRLTRRGFERRDARAFRYTRS
jgi:hemerythrin-like domain-containing protein